MSSGVRLDVLQTEGRNANSTNIDQVSTLELCHIINREDATIAAAVEKCLPVIAETIDVVASRVRRGGRVVYVGAGTSGRLGVLDASEIPPTYSAPSAQFISLIGGGDAALRYAQEGAEDDVTAAVKDLATLNLNPELDSLIGIAASGRTPYVLSCLKFAKSLGCTTVGVACCEPSAMKSEGNVDHMISAVTGPEVVTGSTRMKAGTGTKLVLNMLSTGIMIKCGKTFGNMMIDVKATNIKLQERARNIVKTLCGSLGPQSNDEIDTLLKVCDGSVKLAVASVLLQSSVSDAREKLAEAGGVLAKVLTSSKPDILVSNIPLTLENDQYVLCIDAGGSKCNAVLFGANGEVGRGRAGGCNVSDTSVGTAVASISVATQRAVDSCPSLRGKPFKSLPFASIWIGLAGYARPKAAIPVNSAISKLFDCRIGKNLRISTDIELLVTAIAEQNSFDSAVILVAGTGSVVMSYARDGDRFKQTGRAGGWGHLLGDDGSGYSIGRAGVRIALGAADEIGKEGRDGKPVPSAHTLSQKVFSHFRLDGQDNKNELLNTILSRPESGDQSDTPVKRKIAEVAKVILDAAPENEEANAIVQDASQSLLCTLSALVGNQTMDTTKAKLVLSGGLMQNKLYVETFKQGLKSQGIVFGDVQTVSDTAFMAAQYLSRQLK